MGRLSDITDFHAHILPGADHGSKSLETSESQLKILHSMGVTRVVATPHFYPNAVSVEGFLQRRDTAQEALSTLPAAGLPQVFVGAEVLVCPGIDRMPGLEKLCIKGTNVILLEMPFHKWDESLYEAVYNISRSNMKVVMAHIGRYHSSQSRRLIAECGVSVQLNGENIATFAGRRRVVSWLRAGIVCAFGSDIHGPSKATAKELAAIYDFAGDYGEKINEKCVNMLKGAEPVQFT